jgi:hypothetical protein
LVLYIYLILNNGKENEKGEKTLKERKRRRGRIRP